MKSGETALAIMAVITVAVIPADLFYASRFVPRFKDLEKERIVTSNQLATAKIVSENLNHVRQLVYRNMEFPGQKDSVSQESILFEFLTSCVNDLKMRLVSVRPSHPSTLGRVTTYGYDIELEGDFFSFGEFCSKLENSQRVLALTSFEVMQAKGEMKSAAAPMQTKIVKGAKGGVATVTFEPPSTRRGVTISLHLDTFRVKKGA